MVVCCRSLSFEDISNYGCSPPSSVEKSTSIKPRRVCEIKYLLNMILIMFFFRLIKNLDQQMIVKGMSQLLDPILLIMVQFVFVIDEQHLKH